MHMHVYHALISSIWCLQTKQCVVLHIMEHRFICELVLNRVTVITCVVLSVRSACHKLIIKYR